MGGVGIIKRSWTPYILLKGNDGVSIFIYTEFTAHIPHNKIGGGIIKKLKR
jgi:hypothetical protein